MATINPYQNKPLAAAQVVMFGTEEYEDYVFACLALVETGDHISLGSTVAEQVEAVVNNEYPLSEDYA